MDVMAHPEFDDLEPMPTEAAALVDTFGRPLHDLRIRAFNEWA